jgi:hypothetical protein
MRRENINLKSVIDLANEYNGMPDNCSYYVYDQIIDEVNFIKEKYYYDIRHEIELKKYKEWMKELNGGKKKR